MSEALTIGKVAKQTGVSRDTIRLYERYGLIEPPSRADNGYRQYSSDVVDKLIFILKTKEIGFTLKEIEDLLHIHKTSKKTCGDVRQKANIKLKQVSEKITELKKLETVLKKLYKDCEHKNSSALCPIFVSLQNKK